MGGVEGRQQRRDARAPRPWQLRHRRAGRTVGRRSGAGPLRSPGLFRPAPVDLLPAAAPRATTRCSSMAATRTQTRPRPSSAFGDDSYRAFAVDRPHRRLSPGAHASTARRRPHRRARRADSGRDRRGRRRPRVVWQMATRAEVTIVGTRRRAAAERAVSDAAGGRAGRREASAPRRRSSRRHRPRPTW